MKKNIIWCFLLLAGTVFTSCGDDDPIQPAVPQPDKLTNIICVKNGMEIYTTAIAYDSKGNINNIVYREQGNENTGNLNYTYSYLYNGNEIAVSRSVNGEPAAPYCNYVMLNGRIFKEQYKLLNNSEVYISDEYTYNYNAGNYVTTVGAKITMPKDEGSGYDETNYPTAFQYDWINGNLTKLVEYKTIMTLEYKTQLNLASFTLRPLNNKTFTSWESFNPLNLMYGANNKNLPEEATTTNNNKIVAHYKFMYDMIGEYITSMTTIVTYYDNEGKKVGNDRFTFSFKYNYKVKN